MMKEDRAAMAVLYNEETLKGCPYCGGLATLSWGEKGNGSPWPYVECIDCGAATEPEIWNNRATTHKDAQHAQALNDARAVIEAFFRVWEGERMPVGLSDRAERWLTAPPTDEAGKCPECNGFGYNADKDLRMVKCPECGGDGDISFELENEETGECVSAQDECSPCHGTGQAKEKSDG